MAQALADGVKGGDLGGSAGTRKSAKRCWRGSDYAKRFLEIYHIRGGNGYDRAFRADRAPPRCRTQGALELAIVLPTLNERGNIAPMVARLEEALGPTGWEAIFVDDNAATAPPTSAPYRRRPTRASG